MNQNQFDDYVQRGYNYIPLYREVLADIETPLSVYLKLSGTPYSYLLESVQGSESSARYSMIGLSAQRIIRVFGQTVELSDDRGQLIETHTTQDPLAWIEDYQQRFKVPEIDGLPVFSGGLVGYFGYETVRYIEPILNREPLKPDPIGAPDILLMLSECVLVFDKKLNKIFVIVHADTAGQDALAHAQMRLDHLIERLDSPMARSQLGRLPSVSDSNLELVSAYGAAQYMADVAHSRDYIQRGDVMQVALSQRMSCAYDVPPLSLYRALRTLNPSPYMFYLDLGDHHVVGASPETLVRLQDNQITVRPIAGTRRRGSNADEDQELAQSLLADPKEIAEHLMLIDLARNDIGRVAQTGTVQVTDQMIIERYSHVMHIVSNVIGELQPDLSAIDVLRATFPAGTLSGAPKVRAMQIIQQLEPVKRGIYSGAVGYLNWYGDMDTAIAIRTAVIKQGQLYIQAGAGLVYDSVPESEWHETLHKAEGMKCAIMAACRGLSDI